MWNCCLDTHKEGTFNRPWCRDDRSGMWITITIVWQSGAGLLFLLLFYSFSLSLTFTTHQAFSIYANTLIMAVIWHIYLFKDEQKLVNVIRIKVEIKVHDDKFKWNQLPVVIHYGCDLVQIETFTKRMVTLSIIHYSDCVPFISIDSYHFDYQIYVRICLEIIAGTILPLPFHQDHFRHLINRSTVINWSRLPGGIWWNNIIR